MDMANQAEILDDDTVCISHNANTLGKGMHLIIHLPIIDK